MRKRGIWISDVVERPFCPECFPRPTTIDYEPQLIRVSPGIFQNDLSHSAFDAMTIEFARKRFNQGRQR